MSPEEKQKVINDYQLPQGSLESEDLAETAHSLVFYESKGAQTKRFETLCNIAKKANTSFEGKSVLDVGCGLGNLWEHINTTTKKFDYYGVDITPSLIEGAQIIYPNVRFEERDILNESFDNFEFVIASGIFTDRIEDNEAHMHRMVDKMLEISNIGVAFNFLVAQSEFMYALERIWHKLTAGRNINYDTPEEMDAADLYFYDKGAQLRYFRSLPSVSRATITSGYIPGDTTIHLIKSKTS